MNNPQVVFQDEWLQARKALLAKEKELTRHRDAVNTARRELPMVQIVKDYTFVGPDGERGLVDLFDGRSQLLIYHFMWLWDEDQGCPSCSFIVDDIGHLAHLPATHHWRSSAGHHSTRATHSAAGWAGKFPGSRPSAAFSPTTFTQRSTSPRGPSNTTTGTLPNSDRTGWDGSVTSLAPGAFLRDGDRVFHTCSSYARAGDVLIGTYNWLDLTARGRQEEWEKPAGRGEGPGMGWLEHHDRY